MREWLSKFYRLFDRRRGAHDELSEELRVHLDLLIEDKQAQGLSPEEARFAARRRFGNEVATRERAYQAWQFPKIETILQDLRVSLRSLRKAPTFSLVLIATLALGIGATTAIFSVVYAVLLRPLPYPSGERLVSLGESNSKASGFSVTWINFQHWRAESRSFEDLAGFFQSDFTLTGRGDAVLTHAGLVTSSFFHLTGAHPLLGRLFTEADDHPGAPPTIVVTESFWARTLGADPGVLGETLALNGKAYEVIGVLSAGLNFFSRRVDLYVPLGLSANTVKRNQHGSMRVLGLLKPGVKLGDARAGLDAIMQRLALADPGPEDDHRAFAAYLAEMRTGEVRPVLLILMAAVGLVLIIACANVASLLLVRSTARAREIAIRAAIGAGRARLARQLLTENLLIAALGGVLGVLLALVCLRTLTTIGPSGIPRLSEASLDVHVLIFAAAVTIVAGLLAGLAPVLTAGKFDLTVALKDGAPASAGRSRGQLVRNTLVVAEIAITLVLSFASGLLLRSLIAAQISDPGFDSSHLLALELQLPRSSYKGDDAPRRFYSQLMGQLRAEPGVEAVSAVQCPPSAGSCWDWWYSIVERPAPARPDVPLSLFNIADNGYFSVMRTRLAAGRGFRDTDIAGGPPVAVVTEEFARKWWTAPQLALGNRIKYGGPYLEGPSYEIVGVAANVKQMGLDAAPMPEVYFPFSQFASPAMVVMIRTAGEPGPLIPAVRRQVASIDRNVPIQSLRPFTAWLGATLERRRFSTLLLGAFAALAMILAAVGVYGVLNYWVGVRQKEIAIRVALGAQRASILRWAGSHAIRLALSGIAIGAFGAWGTARWLKSLLFGVSERNPGMLITAAAIVIAIAIMAASLPLWRATQVNAVRNLHEA